MRTILVTLLLLVIFCTACSTAWISTVDSILSMAAPALINILEIVAVANGQPVNAVQVAKINTDAATVERLASDFASASSLAAPGVCSDLQTAIGVYQQDQQLVLSAAQVSDPNTNTKVTLLSDLVAGTVDAILAVLPSCHASQMAAFRPATPLSLKNFVTSYNTILTAKTGNAAVDALTGKCRLHQHSKFVRVATFGMLE
jgi:hypothetical protein